MEKLCDEWLVLILTVEKWCYVAASAEVDLGLKLPHAWPHYDCALYITVGFVQYISN